MLLLGITLLLGAIDLLRLPFSSVDLAARNWVDLIKASGCLALVWLACSFVLYRLNRDFSRMAQVIRGVAERVRAFAALVGAFLPLSMSISVFMYLSSATDKPLTDAELAMIDEALGFNWLNFLIAVNESAFFSTVLLVAYHSLAFQVPLVLFWHAMQRSEHYAIEFIALFGISATISLALMSVIPAAGAYTYFDPGPADFSNFTAQAGMWHYSVLSALRSGMPFELVLTEVNGLVTFPSFHTTLGILVVYSLRHSALWIPVGMLNLLMIIGTLPEGGHYLIDVIAGMMVAATSILAVRTYSARLAHFDRQRNPLAVGAGIEETNLIGDTTTAFPDARR
ncbi:hypothetical protein MesoLjLc_49700 [Mesorhizobium sp. L-8-10]|nr:hypothetical protein MesoLjLc_49700 [Mesorhizobium sp. L-8-10]